ncbi:MAG TPA: hypothetical protein VNB28_09160 [Methylomirabilota bacterium]|nr:hypothetical protein [Methylomirabilota bacterium]
MAGRGPVTQGRWRGGGRMRGLGGTAGLLVLLLGGCVDAPEQRVCYEVYESPTTEFGSRALRVVQCPQGQDG